jgi:hypothetical protein
MFPTAGETALKGFAEVGEDTSSESAAWDRLNDNPAGGKSGKIGLAKHASGAEQHWSHNGTSCALARKPM